MKHLRWAAAVLMLAACADSPRRLSEPVALAPQPSVSSGISIQKQPSNHSAPPFVGPTTSGSAAWPEAPASPVDSAVAHCGPQQAQEFLIRGSYSPISTHRDAHEKVVRYRAETYGFLPGLTPAGWGSEPASAQISSTTFMGLPVQLHRKIFPALRCVEEEIQSECSETYKPQGLAGIRKRNTFRGGEITNHMFGIAIDIDPLRNTCCGCVEPWRSHPLCKNKSLRVEQRMAMPICWVQAFEHHGFYWLGHDPLQDTMHFEFLGDPNVSRSAAVLPQDDR